MNKAQATTLAGVVGALVLLFQLFNLNPLALKSEVQAAKDQARAEVQAARSEIEKSLQSLKEQLSEVHKDVREIRSSLQRNGHTFSR